MNEKATIIRRLEAAYAHALDELENAPIPQFDGTPDDDAIADQLNHLRGHVAGLKQALNLAREAT